MEPEEPVADVPDAPDELVALLDTTSRRRDMPLEGVRALTKAKARIEADAALIAQQDEMIHECASMPMTAEDHAGMERVGKRLFGEDFTLGPFVPTSEYAALRARLAETERLLRNGLRLLCEGRLSPEEVVFAQDVDAFLAGSATPPEAPQQTALARLAAMGAAQVYVHRIQAPAGEWRVMVRRFDGMDLVEKVQGFGATPDEAMRIWLALAVAVAPTEADRP